MKYHIYIEYWLVLLRTVIVSMKQHRGGKKSRKWSRHNIVSLSGFMHLWATCFRNVLLCNKDVNNSIPLQWCHVKLHVWHMVNWIFFFSFWKNVPETPPSVYGHWNASFFVLQEKQMMVYVERRVANDAALLKDESFAPIRNQFCTFREGEFPDLSAERQKSQRWTQLISLLKSMQVLLSLPMLSWS